MSVFIIQQDDLTREATQTLLRLHLDGMHEHSPAGYVHALDVSGLKEAGVTFWSVWAGQDLAGIGALNQLADGNGEIKSMRTDPAHLRKGVAAALLDHIIRESTRLGLQRISLETGSGSAFEPAIALYKRRGFIEGEVFSDYRSSEFNRFYHLYL